jgi:hypothetical protein
MGQRKIIIVGKPLEGQVCPRHQQPGSNSFYGHKGGINHLESSLVQQNLDPETQLLGSEEWYNSQTLGGHVATGTQNGKPRQGGTPTGNDHARQNQNPSLLETRK